MLDLLLIPVTHAIPAVREALERCGAAAPTAAEEHNLSALLKRCVRVSEILVDYAIAKSGKPSSN